MTKLSDLIRRQGLERLSSSAGKKGCGLSIQRFSEMGCIVVDGWIVNTKKHRKMTKHQQKLYRQSMKPRASVQPLADELGISRRMVLHYKAKGWIILKGGWLINPETTWRIKK